MTAETLDRWLQERGLDVELAAKMGWAQVTHRELGPAVKIPYVRDGKIVTSQYRGLGAKEFRFAKGTSAELWNRDVLADESLASYPLVMAEGACDGLALLQCGFVRTVAVPGWSNKNFDPANYAPFTSNEDLIRRAKRIIVAQHADNTGATMLRAIANFFDGCDVAYTVWPKGCKDANDSLLLHGQEAVVKAVSSAREVDPPGGLITGFSDLPPRPQQRVWRVDFPEVEKVMAFRSRAISVLTGRPGSGKTTLATWVAHHLVRANGVRVGFAQFETEPDEVMFHLATLRRGGEIRYCTEDDWAKIKRELDRDFRVVHRIDDNETTHGLAWLKAMIHKLAARDHCGVIIIDPWNELEHLPEPGESLTQYINFALTKIRQWAEKYDCHIMIAAHPRKMAGNDRPDGYSISDSAAWANKADMGWTISIVDAEGEGDSLVPEHVRLDCWKVRSRRQTGCRPGYVKLHYDEDSMVYRAIK